MILLHNTVFSARRRRYYSNREANLLRADKAYFFTGTKIQLPDNGKLKSFGLFLNYLTIQNTQ
ncbi:MAG: hypothetical protein DI529_16365 [Chryseobacterium sp.]|nr:MAG: hypothetical protein DI529_16365 [Chryseobacterium sp.]